VELEISLKHVNLMYKTFFQHRWHQSNGWWHLYIGHSYVIHTLWGLSTALVKSIGIIWESFSWMRDTDTNIAVLTALLLIVSSLEITVHEPVGCLYLQADSQLLLKSADAAAKRCEIET
jgi:hypothetical protein